MTPEELEQGLKEINKKNEIISDEFGDYLNTIKTKHKSMIDSVIQGDIKRYVGLVYEMSLYYSFIFDRKIRLGDYFDSENTKILHRLYSEIAQNILGVYSCLNLGNILGAICLCRTILERIITLKIIFEDPTNKEQVQGRIETYRNLGGVLKYKFAEEINDQGMMVEYKPDFDTYSSLYQEGKYFEYTKAIYGEKKSISRLLRDFEIDNGNNHLYGILSIANHGSVVSNNLLDEKNGLLPYGDIDWYKNIAGLVVTIITLSLDGIVNHINDSSINPVLHFPQGLIISWDKE